MKKFVFALAATTVLLTAACSKGNEDQVNNAEMNQPESDLNALADNAANVANEAEALNQQAQNLENEATTDNTVNPKDADEQNVSGM